MKKVLAVVLVVCVVAGSIAAIRFYLRSHRMNQEVTARLEALVGGQVRVGEVEVGLGSTIIKGVELFEPDREGETTPWLKVASINVDVSLWDLVSGTQPNRVTLQGAAAVLRFDRAGDLLTRFSTPPGGSATATLPTQAFVEAALEQSEITFRKEGHPDLTLTNVSARIDHKSGKLALIGTAENPELGKLLLEGSLDEATRLASVRIKTAAKIPISQPLLNRLPFVPAEVWEQIQFAAGVTDADLTVTYHLDSNALHYRLEVAPENATLAVPAIDLAAHSASGKVTIEDNFVRLRDVKVQAFGGLLFTEADLDFRGEVSELKFPLIKVENLDVNELPEDWNIPPVVRKAIPQGKLFGNAVLDVSIRPAQFSPPAAVALLGATAAPSQWFASASVLAAAPIYEIRAKTQGKGQVRDPAGQRETIDFDWRFTPRRSRPEKPAAKTSHAPLQIERMLAALLTTQTAIHFQAPADKPKGGPDYLDVSFNLKNASLADLIKNQDVKLPFPAEGTVSVQVKASIPIERLDNFKAYKAQGTVQIKQLILAGVRIDEVNADFRYADGILYLTSLKSAIVADRSPADMGGTMQGSGQIQIEPLGDLQLDLTLDRVPAHRFTDLPADKLQGALFGKLSLRGQVSKLQSIRELQGDGTIRSDRLIIYGLLLEQVSTSVRLMDGVLKLDSLKGRVEGNPVDASAELRLRDDYAFIAKLHVREWNLASLKKIAQREQFAFPFLEGIFATNVILEGKLNPLAFKASGDAKARDLTVNALAAKTIEFHWETDGARLNVTHLDAQLYDGKAAGAAVLPFNPRTAGKFDLRIQSVNVKQLAKDLRVPFAIEGNVDGTLKGALPPVEAGNSRTGSLHVDLKAPKLRVQNIPAEQLRGTVDYLNGALDYKLEGTSLGGTFDLEGQIPAPPDGKEPKKGPAKKGRLSIRKVQIAGLLRSLNLPSVEGLKGRLNLEVNYTHDTLDRFPEGTGTLRITNLRWNNLRLAENLQSDVLLSEQQLRLRGLGGDLAQGTFTARLNYHFRQPERSSFTLNLDRVEAGHILAPWLGDKIEGPIQARIRGSLGGTWRGSADLEMARGTVFGLDVAQWRLPIVWSFAPSQNRGQIEIHETSAQVSRGRAFGKMTLAWEHDTRIEGQLRLERVELRDLLRQTIGPSEIGAGQTSARFDFAGNNVRSLNDIGGNLAASFHQAQALQVPVLKQVAPYLGVGSSTTFQKGDLRARLDRGTLRIQQLTLQGNTAQVHVEGTASLEGRLNLDVTAKIGDLGLRSLRLGPLALRIPLAGPVPLVLLQEASALLSNHLVHLQVTGTARSPVIRARPLPIFSEAAVRFFLDRSSLPVTLDR